MQVVPALCIQGGLAECPMQAMSALCCDERLAEAPVAAYVRRRELCAMHRALAALMCTCSSDVTEGKCKLSTVPDMTTPPGPPTAKRQACLCTPRC